VIEASRRQGAAPRSARIHRVLAVRDVSPGAFVLRFSREGLDFRAGQWINLGLPRGRDQREYTVYSSPSDEYLEVLVKEIPDGTVSPALRRLRPGDPLEVEGPHGSFSLVEGAREKTRFLFCATGTGVSPFHCFARSHPGLDYLLLHGVRAAEELYDRSVFGESRMVACITRGSPLRGAHPGRLTDYLSKHPVDPSAYCYLCGNSDMIYQAYALLRESGVPHSQIFAEVYF
jgi:ferredoxin--NADP+ reductase/benzoate/toluate 1,2-dioxygenase reductase subunit